MHTKTPGWKVYKKKTSCKVWERCGQYDRGAAGRQKKNKYELFLLGLVGWGGKLQEAGSSHPAEGKS